MHPALPGKGRNGPLAGARQAAVLVAGGAWAKTGTAPRDGGRCCRGTGPSPAAAGGAGAGEAVPGEPLVEVGAERQGLEVLGGQQLGEDLQQLLAAGGELAEHRCGLTVSNKSS